jgi:hypothetical protein
MSEHQPKKGRTTFYFPEQAAVRLWSIKRLSRHQTNTDVIRAALSSYDDLLSVVCSGSKIFVRDHENRDHPYSPYRPFHYAALERARDEDPVTTEGRAPRNFVFTAESAAKLGSIRQRSFLHSNADVIRAALAAYEELLRVVNLGDHIVVIDRAGNEHPYSPYAPVNPEALSKAVSPSLLETA